MNTEQKSEAYADLVAEQKRCRLCVGLRHPAEPELSAFDSDEIGPWSLGFSRVEWEIKVNAARYEKVPNRPEDNWVWSPQGGIDMHRPEMWGRVLFKREEDGPRGIREIGPVPGKAARATALEIYYAQRNFREANKRWAASLQELGWKPGDVPSGAEPPVPETSADGYTCTVPFKSDDDIRRSWRIRQDRLLKLE